MQRRQFLTQAAAAAAALTVGGASHAALARPSVVIGWNKVLTASIASQSLGPTVAARALSMVYEAIYNAWAAYDWRAGFSLSGLRKRPF